MVSFSYLMDNFVSGFATKAFINFSQGLAPKPAQLFNTLDETSYPLYLRDSVAPLYKPKSLVCFTPICLSGATQYDEVADTEQLCQKYSALAGGFIQTRKVVDGINANRPILATSFGYIKQESRTNYQMELGLDLDSWLSSLKRDSRSRIKKIIRYQGQFELINTKNVADIAAFCKLYSQTSKRSAFSESYQFSEQQWHQLFTDENWQLFLLKHQSRVVAGCVVSRVSGGFDYTFMAHDPGVYDYSRAIIYFLYNYLSSQSSGYLSLGGGISENDSLARFKLGMGAAPVHFRRIKFVVTNRLQKNVSTNRLNELMEDKWPLL